MPLSTDLTLFDVREILDENRKGTGTYKLVRSSLEPDLPRRTECDHQHRSPQEAQVCRYFEQEELARKTEKAAEKPKTAKKKADQFDLLGVAAKEDIAA